jgi:protocatechuate 3,4-dioxygenase, beta subunit
LAYLTVPKLIKVKTVLLLCITQCLVACGQTGNQQMSNIPSDNQTTRNEPPTCECCVFDEVNKNLKPQLKIASDTATGQRIVIRGIVYQSDGKTPAPNVEMYFYQTDHWGRYAKHGTEDRSSFAWWHGYNRGFLVTNHKGEYEINTIKPAPYPARIEPAHIHCLVKSPGQRRCYYVADFVFTDDELLTPQYWQATSKFRTSIGIDNNPDYGGVTLRKTAAGLWEGKRDISLLDEYDLPRVQSGKPIGSESPAFSPQHVAGPDKGSHACPMCKYGYHPGVIVFLNTNTDWENAEVICKRLEKESIKRKAEKFKAYLVYTNPTKLPISDLENKLMKFAKQVSVQNMAITYVPSIDDEKTEMHLNKINPEVKNTIIVYNNRGVFDKFVNFVPTEKAFNFLFHSVEEAGKLKAVPFAKKQELQN